MPLIAALVLAAAAVQPNESLLRFPDIHQDRVVFVSGGDLYIADVGDADTPAVARRLTSHGGEELFPKFSPDGEWVAFSAQYSGTRQVYVMPAAGGPPRQLTYYNDAGPMPPRGGYDYRVLDFSPDGKHVLFRANRLPWGPRMGRPYVVPVEGGMERPLAIPESGGGMYSPDGRSLVYTPIDREFRTWKRHRGGRAQDVWTYDLENDRAERLTTYPGTDNQPMWIGNDIYFTSDRDYTLNLYRYRQGESPEKVTNHDDFDVLWPSAGPSAIVYEHGGKLHRYHPQNGVSQLLNIVVPSDRPALRPRFVDVVADIESFDLSQDGAHVVFGARGELFLVDVEDTALTRNLSLTAPHREHSVTWSPDGERIAYLSDASGEYEIYVRSADGRDEPKRVTTDGDVWRFAPVWSPDGRKLAYGDRKQRLRIVDVESGRTTEVDTSSRNPLNDYAWSPDSRWLAYAKVSDSSLIGVWVYSLEQDRKWLLTDPDSRSYSPAFDPKGRYLYFVSDRDFNLQFSSFEFNYVYSDSARVYAGLLNDDAPALFRPQPAELNGAEDEEEDNGDDGDENGDEQERVDNVEIDIQGFPRRVQALTKTGANVRGLLANDGGVFFIKAGNRSGTLRYFDLEEEEDQKVLGGVLGYALSGDGKKLLYVKTNDRYGVVAAKPGQDDKAKNLKLDRMTLRVDPQIEWPALYVDAWRILRDWFYDPNLHGMDWQAMREKYAALLPAVSTRAELDAVFGELAGELNAGHVYVQSGRTDEPERVAGGLLGATFAKHDSGYFRIESLLPGTSWNASVRSPLTEPGVDVEEGEFLIAVDGRSARDVENVYALLENTADKPTRLTVNSRPRSRDAREVIVTPVDSETSLRYLQWVAERRAMVDRLSNGRVGYIHVPNTAIEGNRELYRGFLAQAEKDALIIDDRYNGGGFIPDRMIEWLDRRPLNYWKTRGQEPTPTPMFSHLGPKAMLINGQSGSGGDALPYYFRKLGLGPLIGTRTWGGLIGISGNPSLADGGSILAATFRFLDTEGNWVVENEGVAPDIEVVDAPDAVAAGRDPSLERAVDYLLQELQKQPPVKVTAPPAPTEF